MESSATNKQLCREFSYEQITLWRVQLQTRHPVDSSAIKINVRAQVQTNQPVESSATNKPPCREISHKEVTCRVYLQTGHSAETSATNQSYSREFSYKNHPVESSATKLHYQLQTSKPVENSAINKSPCMQQKVQLQISYPAESSVTNESPCREFSNNKKSPCTTNKSLCKELSYSTTIKSPCGESSYKHIITRV